MVSEQPWAMAESTAEASLQKQGKDLKLLESKMEQVQQQMELIREQTKEQFRTVEGQIANLDHRFQSFNDEISKKLTEVLETIHNHGTDRSRHKERSVASIQASCTQNPSDQSCEVLATQYYSVPFAGGDPCEFIHGYEEFFKVNPMTEIDRIQYVMQDFEGEALEWYFEYVEENFLDIWTPDCWGDFVAAIYLKFQGVEVEQQVFVEMPEPNQNQQKIQQGGDSSAHETGGREDLSDREDGDRGVDLGQSPEAVLLVFPPSKYSQHDNVMFSCSAGHPAEIIVVFIEELTHITALVTKLNTSEVISTIEQLSLEVKILQWNENIVELEPKPPEEYKSLSDLTTLNAKVYCYMVYSWGGYTFINNLIPMHALFYIVTDHYSSRLYIAYTPLVVLGTLLVALVPVVGFNAVLTSEHFASILVFIIIHMVALAYYIKGIISPKMFKVEITIVVSVGLVVCCAVIAVLVALVVSSPTKGWNGLTISAFARASKSLKSEPEGTRFYFPVNGIDPRDCLEVAREVDCFLRRELYNDRTCIMEHGFMNGPSKATEVEARFLSSAVVFNYATNAKACTSFQISRKMNLYRKSSKPDLASLTPRRASVCVLSRENSQKDLTKKSSKSVWVPKFPQSAPVQNKSQRNLVSWNSILSGRFHNKYLEANFLNEDMQDEDITMVKFLQICKYLSNSFHCKPIHCIVFGGDNFLYLGYVNEVELPAHCVGRENKKKRDYYKGLPKEIYLKVQRSHHFKETMCSLFSFIADGINYSFLWAEKRALDLLRSAESSIRISVSHAATVYTVALREFMMLGLYLFLLLAKCFMSLHTDVFKKYVNNWIAMAAPFQGSLRYVTSSFLNGMTLVEGWQHNFFHFEMASAPTAN